MNSKNKDLAENKRTHSFPRTGKDTPVQYIKGVGPARARLLRRLGIETLEDMLFFFPWRYEDRKNLRKIGSLGFGTLETTLCEVVSSETITTPRKKMKIFELTVTDGSGTLRAKWFNQPYLQKYFEKGQQVILSGVVKGNPYGGGGLEMENPDFEVCGADDTLVHTARIVPVYSATEGLSPKQIRTLMFSITAAHASLLEEYMPKDILRRNNLIPLVRAVQEAHFPEEYTDIGMLNRGQSPAHRRLVFDEFFFLELGLALLKKRESIEQGISFTRKDDIVKRFVQGLPFDLTEAQKGVLREIGADMERPVPMNRLIHGDVGCGKTVVALAAMLRAVENGYQACLMAPTELLAEQHYINISRMAGGLDVSVALLTSGMKEKPLAEISEGTVRIVVGTHALIQEPLQFRNLGLAVIDEQHRFGVVQRGLLRQKGLNPDILVMTATPIPRTLAMTLYGDLDVSVIDQLPAGRRPVVTKVFFPSQRDRIYSLVRGELSKGRQVYIVYPLIEGSEKLDLKSAVDGAEALKKIFQGTRVGLVHGRMQRQERESVMALFTSGDIDMLVATTVIEVGIDIPNASLMLIVHAERFGLAQLHQLRGRIGRGGHDSSCLLLAYPPFSEEAKRRLKAMESTSDGFRIAEEDLAIRGPGDFFGTRQSGMPDLKVADIIRDTGILELARKEAFDLTGTDPHLRDYPLLKEAVQRRWKGRLELIKS
ncbi:MAG: ATP-dependent DNA helicase RecG [Nitrospiraceae bacterium]|nr:MAG: ATP-dependent DNA helicase RecG [Nitrospiraceae bacterium]